MAKPSLVVQLKVLVTERVVSVPQAPKMDSNPTRTRKAMPLTIMRPLYAGLGRDAADLLDYLPKGVVVDIDPGDTLTGYAHFKIDFGSVKDTKGLRTNISAYLSNSIRPRELPALHLRSRRASYNGSKIFSFEEVMAMRHVPAVFDPVKGMTATSLKALTYGLFILHGGPFSADSILPQSFLTGLREACYRYKAAADKKNHERVQDVTPDAVAACGEDGVSFQSNQASVAPARSLTPPLVITPSARKRSFSTFLGPPQTPHEPTLAGTGLGHPPMSPLTPPAELNSILNPEVMAEAVRSAAKIVSIRNPYHVDLQKRAVDNKIALDKLNGMALAQMGPQENLTAPTDALDVKLQEYHKAEKTSLQAARKAEREDLKMKHIAEELAVVKEHKKEALFEMKKALLEEAAGIHGESDRDLRESLASDWFARMHDTFRDQIMAERMGAGDDEAIDGGPE